MEWNKCISEQIAKFYGVQNNGHNSCCGKSRNDPRIEKLKEILAYVDDIVVDDDKSPGETEIEDDTIDGGLKKKIKQLLRK